jgi:hypothetical protein
MLRKEKENIKEMAICPMSASSSSKKTIGKKERKRTVS